MPEALLTAREVGALLGLSAGTILDRFEDGRLPGFRLDRGRVGAPVRFRWSEIEAWLEQGHFGPDPLTDGERFALHLNRVKA